MTVYKEYNFGGQKNPLGNFGALIILILFFVVLFFIAKGIFTILSYVAPVLLILSLIIDYTALIDFGKFIVKLFKNNILAGILAVLLTIVGFPIVAGFIFFRSIVRRKLKSITSEYNKETDYAEYEEVEEETEFLELPKIEIPPEDPPSEYDDLFK